MSSYDNYTFTQYFELPDVEKCNYLTSDCFGILIKKNLEDINKLFDVWIDCKRFGLLEKSQEVLTSLIKISMLEKRIWMLKKIDANLGKRNIEQKKQIKKGIVLLVQNSFLEKNYAENFSSLKIVERELSGKNFFMAWLEFIKDKEHSLELFRLIYLGILIHGVDKSSAFLLSAIIKRPVERSFFEKIKREFDLASPQKNKQFSKNSIAKELSISFDYNKVLNTQEHATANISVELIDIKILTKYLNDILFSLYCMKDYAGIYKINDVLECSFRKNAKEYLTYNFYRLSALIDDKKFRQAMSILKNEVLACSITNLEAMPFLFLLAESYLGLGKYEKALEIFFVLQKDEVFHGKAKLKINEISKN